MRSRLPVLLVSAALALGVTVAPVTTDAFCGFYVGGADATLFNNATQVVLMRKGTKTVLSMQNNYEGPPERFAMVVPVPVVLQEDNVKTLPREIFRRVDQLAAPRLVEYWEQDPCPPPQPSYRGGPIPPPRPMKSSPAPAGRAADLGVTVEAQFTVGEYEIVILGARDSLGLDTWIRREGYSLPPGAEPLLRPYVQAGMKFFVAKVDVSKITFEKGRAMLSPLRFHYDSETFALPVRLGLMSSSGTQDLIVHVLGEGQRYEVANFDNVTIPTNLDLAPEAQPRFGELYAALFDRTLERHPGAVVTEYSWDASSCDPCPTPSLTQSELSTLGADVLDPVIEPEPTLEGDGRPVAVRRRPKSRQSFVITRLHARYGRDSLGQDLVFRTAPPIQGGREVATDGKGNLEQGAIESSRNNFQARYAIRHPWTGPIRCKHPVRGVWGGPPEGSHGSTKAKAAVDLAFAPRGNIDLAPMLPKTQVVAALETASVLSKGTPMDPFPPIPQEELPQVATEPKAAVVATSSPATTPPAEPVSGGCAGCDIGSVGGSWGGAAAALGALGLLWRRKRGERSR